MKKYLLISPTLFLLLSLTGTSHATSADWTDIWEPPGNEPIYLVDSYLWQENVSGSFHSYTYRHDIAEVDDENRFVPGQDIVYWYDLAIGVEDDEAGDCREIAWINLPGVISDRIVEIDYSDVNIGISLAGILSLNRDGTLAVTITSLLGDFYLVDSTLAAYGCETMPNPVPIPAPALLLGAGLVGLLALRRSQAGA